MKLPYDFLSERKKEIDRVIKEDFMIESRSSIPDWNTIPLEGKNWLQAESLACVYIDMVNSTKLHIDKQAKTAAKAYQLFVENMVQTLQDYDCEFIDIKGDGGFGIFVGANASIKALCAAVTFKTLCQELLATAIKDFKISAHIGIDEKHSLFKRIGLRGDWHNVVWAGKPVNMAAKLSALAGAQQIAISNRVFEKITQPKFKKYACLSCGCTSEGIFGEPTSLWSEVDVSEEGYFDFESAYVCKSNWCKKHGNEYCQKLMKEAK
jgi:class 3 adenylate cyclase